MPENGSPEGATWPMPKFQFELDLGAELKGVEFQEVSGLDSGSQPIKYKHGNGPTTGPEKMPGIAKNGNVTLKRGVFTESNDFWKWVDKIKMNTKERSTIFIKLLDETGKTTMKWQLENAWPSKISGIKSKSNGNVITVEELEIVHEGLIVTKG
jgi:phage tail-like protein